MAIITTVTEEPTGALAAQLPVLLHSPGVAGYTHRWTTRQVKTVMGAPIAAWLGTSGAALAAGAGKSPLLVESAQGAVAAAAFDGTDDVSAATGLGTIKTIALVIRVTAAASVNTGIMSTASGNFAIVRTGSNTIGIFTPGGTKTNPVALTSWCLVTLAVGPTTAETTVNGLSLGTQTNTAPDGFSDFRLGSATGAFGKLEVAEAITYPTALTAGQSATMYAALKSVYPLP